MVIVWTVLSYAVPDHVPYGVPRSLYNPLPWHVKSLHHWSGAKHDDVIWMALRHNHCSFMAKITTGPGIFCKNPYNVTGLCNRSSCPLSNSRYATIRDHDGVFYLYMKTIERAHMPNKLWERIKLPRNYEQAMAIIDKNLEYWPKLLIHKIKQRLTKMTQYRIRMRKLALKVREKIMTVPRKEKKREARREEKAQRAALLEKSIENELLERLNKGVYGDIYNYPVQQYENILDKMKTEEEEEEEEEEPEIEYVEGYDELEEEEEEDMEDFGGYMKDGDLEAEEDDDDDEEQLEEPVVNKKRKGLNPQKADDDGRAAKLKRKGKVIIEYEGDEDMGEKQKTRA